MTGLETALSVVQEAMVDTGALTWRDVARVLSETPAKIGLVDDLHGRPLSEGEPANLVLVDPQATREIHGAEQVTHSANTPFEGRELPGRIVATFLRGAMTYADPAATSGAPAQTDPAQAGTAAPDEEPTS
jgi:dihydroorotase